MKAEKTQSGSDATPVNPTQTPDSASRSKGLLFYLMGVLGIPAFLFVLCILLLPTVWVAAHTGNQFLASVGYGEKLHHADCQVLIYGDSGALVDADPAIIASRTGLSACNIAEVESVTAVNGTLPVDHYLQRNNRPRFLIFLFAPEHYRGSPADWTGLDSVNGITYRIRYEHTWKTLWLLLRNPVSVLSWAEGGLQIMMHIHPASLSDAELNYRPLRNGRYPMPDARALKNCPSTGLVPPDPSWMADLKNKYEADGTKVLLDVLPLPECDPDYSFYKSGYQRYFDNDLLRFPLSVYVDNGRLHMNDNGSETFSTLLAEQISKAEGH